MKKLDAVVVVEGKSDRDFLSSFLDCEIVTTNGSEVSRETIKYIDFIAKTRDVVVLTDPDSPGNRIRAILDREIPGLLHAYVLKKEATRNGKVGVAESTIGEVLRALSVIETGKRPTPSDLVMSDMFELGLAGSEDAGFLREDVGEKMGLGHATAKVFFKRAKAAGVTRKQLEEAINERK